MDLYDPDRLRTAKQRQNKEEKRYKKVPAAQVFSRVQKEVQKGGYVILSGPIFSPLTHRILQNFLQKNPGGRHLTWNPNSTHRRGAQGEQICYGERASLPLWRFDRAQVIVSIDGDFLGSMPGTEYYSRLFAKSRAVRKNKKTMNRLIVFESMLSVTGSNADHRFPILPNHQLLIVLALLANFSQGEYKKLPQDVSDFLRPFHPQNIENWVPPAVAKNSIFDRKRFAIAIEQTCQSLWQAQGKSLIVGGGPQHENGMATEVQVGMNLLNSYLGNDGKTVQHELTMLPASKAADSAGLSQMLQLAEDCKQGQVKSLILLDSNPIYHLPKQSSFAEALQKIPYICAVCSHLDESAAWAHDVFPLSHYFESWNYYEPVTGVHAVAQPLIRPLYESLSVEDFLMKASNVPLVAAENYYQFIRQNVNRLLFAKRGNAVLSAEKGWAKLLQQGYHHNSESTPTTAKWLAETANGAGASARRLNTAKALASLKQGSSLLSAPIKTKENENAETVAPFWPLKKNQLQLGLYHNVQVRHGDRANNTLHQELPEPITKIVWDNYAAILPETARNLGVRQGDILEIRTTASETNLQTTCKIPAHLQPGLHPKTVMIAQGYGRTKGGRIAQGVGQPTNNLIGIHPQVARSYAIRSRRHQEH